MDNRYHFSNLQQEYTVYLTPNEKEQLELYIEKITNSRTLAEASIYNRKIKGLVAKGKSRKR